MTNLDSVAKPTLLGRAWVSPGCLLVAVGTLLGLNFPLGKVAVGAGVSPFVWAALISLGGAIVLAGVAMALRRPVRFDWQHARYFGINAMASYAIPNALTFSLIPKLGSGYIAIFFTLSPMLTVALSLLARLRRPSALELRGVAIGFAGAVTVAAARGQIGQDVDWLWAFVGLLIPLSLACGNVYRTKDWPAEASGLWLAIGSNAVAGVCLIALSAATGGIATAGLLLTVPAVTIAQVIISATMFILFFRLQAIGGPVTLSQIGTIAAAVGVVIGTFILGERYSLVMWSGVALIAAGIALTLIARLRT